jgi:hypothetical protein
MSIKGAAHILALGAALAVSGCATIVSGGGKQQLTFNSEPPDATVTMAGRALGKTPLTVTVDRAKNMALVVEKEGYKPFTTQLSTRLNSWFWGNILIGGLLGSTTDGVSGAINEYSPDQYFVTLVPNKPFGVEENRRSDLKQLLVGSGTEVRKELSNGEGEYVNSLLKLLQVGDADRAKAIETLKKVAATTPDDLEMANKVIEIYEVK